MKTEKILNHLYFLLIAALAVIFADQRTLHDASLYLKINSLFFADGLDGLFAAGIPKISAITFSLTAIIPAYIIFLIFQHALKSPVLTKAFLITLASSSVLFLKPYTFFQATYIAQGVPIIIVFLRICTTYFLEILLWIFCIYSLYKQKQIIKAILLAILFPASVAAIFNIFDLAGIIEYADFTVVAMLFFFNIYALKKYALKKSGITATTPDLLFYILITIALFVYSVQLLPEKKKLDFFESTYTALESKEKLSYYDARHIDLPPLILQRYGNKQINSEFLTYSLFKHHKSIIILFPHGEIINALDKNIDYKNISQEIFSYKTKEMQMWFTDTTLFTDRNIRDSVPFDWYIPVRPSDSVYVSVERAGDNNGYIYVMGYDNRRVPSFIMWANSNDYFKKHGKHDGAEWEYLYVNCLVPPKTEEIRVYIKNHISTDMIDTICFRNVKVEILRSEIRF